MSQNVMYTSTMAPQLPAGLVQLPVVSHGRTAVRVLAKHETWSEDAIGIPLRFVSIQPGTVEVDMSLLQPGVWIITVQMADDNGIQPLIVQSFTVRHQCSCVRCGCMDCCCDQDLPFPHKQEFCNPCDEPGEKYEGIHVRDGKTVRFSGDGSRARPLQAGIIISQEFGNGLQVREDGLYSAAGEGTAGTHNDIPGRNFADCHPAESITDAAGTDVQAGLNAIRTTQGTVVTTVSNHIGLISGLRDDVNGLLIRDDCLVAAPILANVVVAPDGDSLKLDLSMKNMSTCTVATQSRLIQLASVAQPGLMPASAVQQLTALTQQVSIIEGGQFAKTLITYTELQQNASQSSIQAAWEAAGGDIVPAQFDTILSLHIDSLNFSFSFIGSQWEFRGSGVKVLADNTGGVGVVTGSLVAGQVQVEPNGQMSVNGWNALNARVAATEQSIITLEQNVNTAFQDITTLSSNFNSFKTSVNSSISNIDNQITSIQNEMSSGGAKNIWLSQEFLYTLAMDFSIIAATHNLNLDPAKAICELLFVCKTADYGYAVGDYTRVHIGTSFDVLGWNKNSIWTTINNMSIQIISRQGSTKGSFVSPNNNRWAFILRVIY